jgi:hypothetical protein
LRIATFNAENLDANDPASRFDRIAVQIVGSLGAPDILALQEVQDDDGVDVTMTVTAGATLAKLIAARSGPRMALLTRLLLSIHWCPLPTVASLMATSATSISSRAGRALRSGRSSDCSTRPTGVRRV